MNDKHDLLSANWELPYMFSRNQLSNVQKPLRHSIVLTGQEWNSPVLGYYNPQLNWIASPPRTSHQPTIICQLDPLVSLYNFDG